MKTKIKVILIISFIVLSMGIVFLTASSKCTTILVGKDATADGSVILGHNEDMGTLSGRLVFVPKKYHEDEQITVNYETIPQVPETYQYWASGNSTGVAEEYYDGGWILCGMNEFGVSYGCNTIFTKEDKIERGEGILRYSIRQLILERAQTSREAVKLIGNLIDQYGQSDSAVAFCIADHNEAWVIEASYRQWVAKRVPDDEIHVEANQLTIETDWDLASDNLVDYAEKQGWYDSAEGPFNFKYVYCPENRLNQPSNTGREYQASEMLKNKIGSISVKDILSVLSQPPIQRNSTQAYMVWHLRNNMPIEIGALMWHGMCGANTSIAVPVYAGSTRAPSEYLDAGYRYDPFSAWWKFEALQKLVYPNTWVYTRAYPDVIKMLNEFQEALFEENAKVEEEALELWQSGNEQKARELISDHTYKYLMSSMVKADEAVISALQILK